jgi:hypothetical protein
MSRSGRTSCAWWYMSIIPAFEKFRQKDKELQDSLETLQDHVFKKQRSRRGRRKQK